jgi:hypothetical protein
MHRRDYPELLRSLLLHERPGYATNAVPGGSTRVRSEIEEDAPLELVALRAKIQGFFAALRMTTSRFIAASKL